jgi:hypothetical protein
MNGEGNANLGNHSASVGPHDGFQGRSDLENWRPQASKTKALAWSNLYTNFPPELTLSLF